MSTEPKQPIIQRNTFPRRECDVTRLPFVQDVKVGPRRRERKFWCVPEVECYAAANVIGAQYAADWLQYLQENPGMVGSGFTGWLAKGMYQGAGEAGAARGIAVGFWALIEVALSHPVGFDHYAAAEAMAQRYADSSCG